MELDASAEYVLMTPCSVLREKPQPPSSLDSPMRWILALANLPPSDRTAFQQCLAESQSYVAPTPRATGTDTQPTPHPIAHAGPRVCPLAVATSHQHATPSATATGPQSPHVAPARRPPEIIDCAALVRFAYRDVLRTRNAAGAARARLPQVPALW